MIAGVGLHHADHLDDVHRMLAEAEEAGIDKDEVTFTTLIGAHSLAGDLEAAKSTFDAMEKSGMGGNPLSYVIMMNSAIRHRNQTFAFDIMRRMETQGVMPTDEAVHGLIKHYFTAEAPDSAWVRCQASDRNHDHDLCHHHPSHHSPCR